MSLTLFKSLRISAASRIARAFVLVARPKSIFPFCRKLHKFLVAQTDMQTVLINIRFRRQADITDHDNVRK